MIKLILRYKKATEFPADLKTTFRVFGIVTLLVIGSYGLQSLALPNRHVAGTQITADAFNANNDSLVSIYNNQKDSLNQKFWRKQNFKDSTLDTIKVKKIKSVDSITVTKVISHWTKADSVTADFSGNTTLNIARFGMAYGNSVKIRADSGLITNGSAQGGNVWIKTGNLSINTISKALMFGDENQSGSYMMAISGDSLVIKKANGMGGWTKVTGFYIP